MKFLLPSHFVFHLIGTATIFYLNYFTLQYKQDQQFLVLKHASTHNTKLPGQWNKNAENQTGRNRYPVMFFMELDCLQILKWSADNYQLWYSLTIDE
jgi:hypothetical protein